MRSYLIKTPWWLRQLYPALLWHMPWQEKAVYLSFDDGPHPEVTPFVLDQLKKFNARASFFCIGKNVQLYPEIATRILEEGHSIGNHTQHHVNGWKTSFSAYLDDVRAAREHISSSLFRPPYGRITRQQAKAVKELLGNNSRIVMWDVLSADFDINLSGEQCLHYVVRYARPGSIIVMHDSAKAWPRLEYMLPRLLQFFHDKGYDMKAIRENVEK
jgi:peptidoglycan/xylan/chitin deacetylase (PgdA/CDA1 family)